MGFLSPGVPKFRKQTKKRKTESDSPRPHKRSRSSPSPSASGIDSRSASESPYSSPHSTPTPSIFTPKRTQRKSSWTPSQTCTPLLSPLELLPIELIQKVFLLSTNLSLPLASPHLHHFLASRFLQLKVLSNAYDHPSTLTDLISRRFFNYSILHSCEARYGSLNLCGVSIPTRLLQAPFTNPNLVLLKELISRGAKLDENDLDTPKEGLRQAIRLRCTEAITLLVGCLGVKCSPDIIVMGIESELFFEGPGGLKKLMERCDNLGAASIWWATLGRLSSQKHDLGGPGAGNTGVEIGPRSSPGEVLTLLMENATVPGEVLGAIGKILAPRR